MKTYPVILQVAVQSPLFRLFDYLPEKGAVHKNYLPGARVRVTFGRRHCVGVIVSVANKTDCPVEKLKPILALIDDEPLLSPLDMQLLKFASDYYCFPLGEVLLGTLPKKIRQGAPAELLQENYYEISALGKAQDSKNLKRAPKQAEILALLMDAKCSESELKSAGVSSANLKKLIEKGWIINAQALSARANNIIGNKNEAACISYHGALAEKSQPDFELTIEQQAVLQALLNALNAFHPFLLSGITGSGKTEIYLRVIARIIAEEKQALVLVPEIALTPQTVRRFKERFNCEVLVLHSGLSDKVRMEAFLKARSGLPCIVIGTRSAVFTPLPNLGVIIVDEEHDDSFKQQTRFRYHARDIAVKRASLSGVPIVLGSATPSLVSWHNVVEKKYKLLELKSRPGSAQLPHFIFQDMKSSSVQSGFSKQLIDVMQRHLKNDSQVLVYLNRRGYAPVLICHHCGWTASCHRCDAKLTLHKAANRLLCHHCHFISPIFTTCQECRQSEVVELGVGTEQLALTLQQLFPNKKVLRLDRDVITTMKKMDEAIHQIRARKADIVVGTQLLVKGHHFPNVTLVAVMDVDSALFSSDYRATEKLAQSVIQVAGRAGRGDKKGAVFIQTYQPTHPIMQALKSKNYFQAVNIIDQERLMAQLPPYRSLAAIQVKSRQKEVGLNFLKKVKRFLNDQNNRLECLGPYPASMSKKAGFYYSYLLLSAGSRSCLHQYLVTCVETMQQRELLTDKVNWIVDMDPLEIM